ncbi:MAG: VanZ family protein [Phycisphaerales bacterium]|nr:MAG: VanZ family protein [Phycisphaerales bacterium]
MSRRKAPEPLPRVHWIHSTRLHVVMYSMLLVATPFLLMRNFLQPAILRFSRFGFEVAGTRVPIVPVLALVVLVGSLIAFRRYLTRIRVLAGVIVLLLNALAQQVADYYFDHNFYDLQQNWHYFAYLTFCIMLYRDLAPRGVRKTRIMLITFFLAVSFSTFDETVQLGISGRAFEMGDIAKDAWGSVMGIVLLYIGGSQPEALRAQWRQVRHETLPGYLENPASIATLLAVLGFLFVSFASLLGERSHWYLTVLLTVGCFVLFFVLLHLSQRRWVRYGLVTVLVAALGAQSYFFVKHRADYIMHNGPGLTVYKGIPAVFFDVMVFPDDTFRPVPKKHTFTYRDIKFFLKQETDIILLGSGTHGRGGRGFPQEARNQFMFNEFTKDGTQVIILPNSEACQAFNRLKSEGKNVLFILHNTC